MTMPGRIDVGAVISNQRAHTLINFDRTKHAGVIPYRLENWAVQVGFEVDVTLCSVGKIYSHPKTI